MTRSAPDSNTAAPTAWSGRNDSPSSTLAHRVLAAGTANIISGADAGPTVATAR